MDHVVQQSYWLGADKYCIIWLNITWQIPRCYVFKESIFQPYASRIPRNINIFFCLESYWTLFEASNLIRSCSLCYRPNFLSNAVSHPIWLQTNLHLMLHPPRNSVNSSTKFSGSRWPIYVMLPKLRTRFANHKSINNCVQLRMLCTI